MDSTGCYTLQEIEEASHKIAEVGAMYGYSLKQVNNCSYELAKLAKKTSLSLEQIGKANKEIAERLWYLWHLDS